MSPVRRATAPRVELFRIGHLPDPLAWPPKEVHGAGRFDDPLGEYRVLYAGQRRTCFLETLAAFRPSVDALAALQAVRNTDEPLPVTTVPAGWYRTRAVSRLRLLGGQRWLDVRAADTLEVLRGELAANLAEWRMTDLDLSDVMSRDRRLTQAISRWAYDEGFHGVVYSSRFGAGASLWAIFEGAQFEAVGVAQPILPDDPDLLAVATLFGLAV